MSQDNSMVGLKSSDEEIFEVEMAVACMSETVKNMMVDVGDLRDSLVPLPKVSSKTLAKVIDYCEYHAKSEESSEDNPGVPEEDTKQWDAVFVKLNRAMIIDLIMASDYLNIPKLLDLVCPALADMMKGKTAEEIRKTFGIKNDFTPEEEEEMKRDHELLFSALD